MKIATCTTNYEYGLQGTSIKSFLQGHSYIMADMILRDIVTKAGSQIFAGIRELDGTVYRKYGGQPLHGKSIMIWRTGGMGDLCFITPYLKRLKELYPTCRIVFSCAIQYSDVMSKHPCVDEFHNVPVDVQLLDSCDYHLMFEGIIENNPEAESKNAYDLFGEYFCLDIPPEQRRPYLTVDPENIAYFRGHEAKLVKVERPIKIGIHLKTSSIIRDVSARVWRDLISGMLAMDDRIVLYVMGAPDDNEILAKIPLPPSAVGRFVAFNGVTRGFRDTIALVSEMDLVIGGDSSGLHVAGAFRKPMIGLFGAFRADLRISYYENAIGVQAKTKCAPCFQHGNNPCEYSTNEGGSYCMEIINFKEHVADNLQTLLLLTNKIEPAVVSPRAMQQSLRLYKENTGVGQ